MRRLAALVLTLTLAAAAPTAARAGEPAAEPPEVAALEWREACTLEHTRVEVPLSRMPDYLFEEWGLPRTADPDAWRHMRLIMLGLAFEGDHVGLGMSRRAAHAYCLALRRDRHALAPILLSRLHARGRGVAFSPTLSRHFARVAAPTFGADEWRGFRRHLRRTLGLADLGLFEKLTAAEAWFEAMSEKPPVEIAALATAYRNGDGVPRSHILADELLGDNAIRDTGLAVAYARHMIAAHPERVRSDLLANLRTLRNLHRAAREAQDPAAQHLLGQVLLAGEVVPRNTAIAFVWLTVARRAGAPVTIDLQRLDRALRPEDRARLREFIDYGRLPDFHQSIPPE